jgi:cleavage and polyadenylation specificity factor subunit 2
VGYVHGRIAINGDSSVPILEYSSIMPVHQLNPSIDRSPGSLSTRKALAQRQPSSLPQSTIIGDLRLTALKSRLAALGISAEFAGEGVLVCNGASGSSKDEYVAVKKSGRGQVILEGAPSGVYYTVRQEVYDLHAVVVAQ